MQSLFRLEQEITLPLLNHEPVISAVVLHSESALLNQTLRVAFQPVKRTHLKHLSSVSMPVIIEWVSEPFEGLHRVGNSRWPSEIEWLQTASS
jgi:hypothetical protein